MSRSRTRSTRTFGWWVVMTMRRSSLAAGLCTLAAVSGAWPSDLARADPPASNPGAVATAAVPPASAKNPAAKSPAPASSAAPSSAPANPVTKAPAAAVSDAAKACFQKAQSAYAAGDLASALAGFKCAYDAAPSAELDYNIARVYERMGDAEESTRHYRAYLAKADVTPKELKRIQAKLQALKELRERQHPPLTPAQPSAAAMSAEARVFYDRGVKLYRTKQYPAALAAFSAALQMSNAPELHFNLAVVAERLDRTQEAIDHYRAYLAARPDARDRDQIEARIDELQASD